MPSEPWLKKKFQNLRFLKTPFLDFTRFKKIVQQIRKKDHNLQKLLYPVIYRTSDQKISSFDMKAPKNEKIFLMREKKKLRALAERSLLWFSGLESNRFT